MKVITYFQPIDKNDPDLWYSQQSVNLVEKWEDNWAARGWTPVVLNEEYAKSNCWYSKIQLDINKSFFLKGKGYYKQCFLRWLAYTQFAFENGPTVWADYDVYNYRFDVDFLDTVQDPKLFCAAGSCGIMNKEIGEQIMSLFYKFSLCNSIKEVDFVDEEEKKYFLSNSELLSDMYFIKWIFRNKTNPLLVHSLRTHLSETKNDFFVKRNTTREEFFKKFYMFHLHGGILQPKNENVILIDLPKDSSVKTRADLWNFFNMYVNRHLH